MDWIPYDKFPGELAQLDKVTYDLPVALCLRTKVYLTRHQDAPQ